MTGSLSMYDDTFLCTSKKQRDRTVQTNSLYWISIKPGFWDIMAKEANFLTVKYLTVDVSTARLCHNPVKYFMLLRGCLCARTCW